MAAPIGLRGDYDGAVLRGLAKRSKDAGQARRLLALSAIYDGGSRGDAAKLGGYDVVLLDTAGRVTVDDELMREVADVKRDTNPHEVLLVADSLTGQDAVNTATAFDGQVGITGIVLTRADGDGRGGAALSMRAVTGKPIKLIGVGEKWDALEDFDPKRIAGRILGMGDVVGLVEKAIQNVDMQKAQEIAQKMRKGAFDLEDLSDQLKQMEKMGGMGGLMGMMPGVAKLKSQINEAGLEKELKRQRAIISSMTPHERRNPKVLNAKRKKRIAAGSGTTPADINKLLKMHLTMADMMKKMRGKGGLMSKMMGGMGGGGMFGMGGGGAAPSAAELAKMKEELSKLDPRALEQLPQEVKDALEQAGGGDAGGAGAGALPKGLPGGLPGLGGMGGMPKLPGLGGGGLPGLGGPRFPMMPGKKKK